MRAPSSFFFSSSPLSRFYEMNKETCSKPHALLGPKSTPSQRPWPTRPLLLPTTHIAIIAHIHICAHLQLHGVAHARSPRRALRFHRPPRGGEVDCPLRIGGAGLVQELHVGRVVGARRERAVHEFKVVRVSPSEGRRKHFGEQRPHYALVAWV